MPFRSENPIVRVEPTSMHTIDTSNVQNLFGLWSVFSKCAGTMEDGKRLENMSWRLWNRETFCCAPDQSPYSPRWQFARRSPTDAFEVPELSSSVDSDVSTAEHAAAASQTRPALSRLDSTDSRRSRKKHMTPIDLQNMVISIKESKEIEPLPELPAALQPETARIVHAPRRVEDTTPRPSSPPCHPVTESSTSTVATAVESDLSNMSPPVGSEASTSTDLSSHSVVRGFSLGRVSSSLRSKTQLAAAPAPILKNSPHKIEVRRSPEISRKKGGMFQLGASSEEEASSVETRYMNNSQMSDALKRPAAARKRASFKIGDDLATAHSDDDEDATDSEAITDDDDNDDPDESAIEDDDDEEWLSEDESGPSSVKDDALFQRVDSRPQLSSRRSLLTTGLHERDRAAVMQAEASRLQADSRSAPAMRRSRTTSPNGPSLASSPKHARPEPNGMVIPPKPLIMTTSNVHPPALSPRTTRRNMLSTELTESLRKHLLWERQQKNATSNAALKRRHTSNDVKNLKHYPSEAQTTLAPISENAKGSTVKANNNSWNAYFDHGLQEYHVKGW